jgi:preprotein translocase subunit SecD
MKAHVALSSIRAASLALVLAASAACALPFMSGPRDTGGVYMILAVKADAPDIEQAVAQASEVIMSRCNALGVYCKVERQVSDGGPNLFKLRVSGAQDFQRVKDVLLAQGTLELRPVVSRSNPAPLETYPAREAALKAAGGDYDVVTYEEDGRSNVFLVVEREPVVSGLDVRDAKAEVAHRGGGGETDNYMISFSLKAGAAYRFGEWTDKNVGRYLAVVLNGKARSAPYIKSRITDSGQITGSFTKQQAEDAALTLRSGKLPTPIVVLEEGKYEP